MQWKNPDGSITTGVVIEDGAGAKITSFSGGGGSNANFAPNGNTTQLSVSTTSARVALPAGVTVMVYNTGAQPAFVAFGGSGVVATSAGDEVPAGGALPFAPGGATYIAAIAASGGTSLNITGGSGLGLALSGGSSGGGGSNASIGTTGATAPSLATELGFIDGSGNLRAPSKTSPLPDVITDPTTGFQSAVLAFHNTDNQTLGATTYGLNTGGVAQLVNGSGNLDRQRETSLDGAPAVGVAAGAQQLAGPPLATTVTSGAITGSASPQNVTLAAVNFSNRGVTTSLQAGSTLVVDTGLNQELVYLSAVNIATKVVNGVFKNSHSAGVAVYAFGYNQARDATIPDGSTPAGIAASAAYFYNAPNQTVEMERSAAGELDGASGIGTAVAAEYEWNGGGPLTNTGAISGLAFDRARNLQGKGAGGSTLNGAVAGGVTSITLNAVVGLNPGQQIRLDAGAGAEESAYVSQSFTIGSLSVPLQLALANPHANGAAVAWDIFASAGPGLNGFTPAGVSVGEEALYDPVSAKYYIERAATQDGCAPQNVVLESCGLWNGASIDRLRSVSGDAMPTTGLEASVDLLWNGTSYDRPRAVSSDAQSATGIPVKALMLWNGATYDRAYGDKSNGLFVNVRQLPALPAGSNIIGGVTQSGAWAVSISGTPIVQSAALAPVVTSSAASALQLKASAGNLLSLMATSTVSGWLLLFDATAAPADGAVTPKWVYPIAANGALNMAWPSPLAFASGIVAVFSTTGPFNKTASTTAFISGQVQ
ncbi:hypothetical protein [Methylocystis bryophila]|uniref:Uncharacterized protein n=1 Tax=Methylocystis bryophila TaxID=655015 RepID=A0A1W6MX38_9HYPH|nr:hypothetical protein [Methylocystis bryophila]ARN82161.1 hypothetical protein B1812_14920 [Methylocystis bryophila]BDV38293.1 hypothetical protein DSM21852_15460 [Methylocystis bryophila]